MFKKKGVTTFWDIKKVLFFGGATLVEVPGKIISQIQNCRLL